MPTESHTETLALRTALRELIALSTIPAVWVGKEAPVIATGLADVLVGSLQLDFVFVRLCDPKGGPAIELTRGHAWEAFPEWLETHVGDAGQFSSKQIVPDVGDAEPCRGVVIPIGVNIEGGVVAAACGRTDFPSEIDQLLLSVAANGAATAFQRAYLSSELDAKVAELSRARNELEMKVAERTADLRRSEAYLAEARDSPILAVGHAISSRERYATRPRNIPAYMASIRTRGYLHSKNFTSVFIRKIERGSPKLWRGHAALGWIARLIFESLFQTVRRNTCIV
jgi:hypothetical protein